MPDEPGSPEQAGIIAKARHNPAAPVRKRTNPISSY
jgi:hypothetical protein